MEATGDLHPGSNNIRNPMKNKLWIPVVALLMMISIAAKNSRTITGTVSSASDGSALPGVNVNLKGTLTRTTTDGKGQYSITTPVSGGKLEFSFIGLKTLVVPIGTSDVLNVKLEDDVQKLNEAIVNGKPEQALQGKIAGVQTTGAK